MCKKSLLCLPPELLLLILSQLVLGTIPTNSTAELNDDFRSRLAALRNLCLTCTVLRAFAQPLLHRNVVITRQEQCVLLFRTLVGKEHLRDAVQKLACLVVLDGEGHAGDALLDYWKAAMPTFRSPEINHFEETLIRGLQIKARRLEESKDRRDDLRGARRQGDVCRWLHRMFAMTLSLTSRIEDLLIRVPAENQRPYHYNVVEVLLKLSDHLRLKDVCYLLQRLRTLRLQVDPLSQLSEHGGGFLPTFLPTFEMSAPTRLEFYGDNGDWFDATQLARLDSPGVQDQNLVESLTSVKELRMYESRTSPAWVYQFVKNCPNLKTFCWTFRQANWFKSGVEDTEDLPPILPKRGLNEALMLGANSIEHLRLESRVHNRSPELGDDQPWELVTCLSSFCNLKTLTIDLLRLYGPDHATRIRNRNVSLRTLLPPSLEELELVETLHPEDIKAYSGSVLCYSKYHYWLETVMASLLDLDGKPKHFVRLKRVRLRTLRSFNGISCWHLSYRSPQALRDGSRIFEERGMSVEWAWHDG